MDWSNTLSDNPGNEFWRVEDAAVRDEFAAIFRSEAEELDLSDEDLADVGPSFADSDGLEAQAIEPDFIYKLCL